MLGAVLSAVRHAAGYPDVLTRICQGLTTSVPCDRATIYVWSRRRRAFLPAADHGTPAEVVGDFIRRGFSAGAFPGTEELRAGRAVLAVRGKNTPELDEMLTVARLHALAVLPLAFQGEGEGALACGLHGAPAFRRAQVTLLESLAPHIAVIIQNARLEARASRLAERRARLAAWAAEVLAAGSFDEMAGRLCEASRTLFGATRAALMVVDGDHLAARRIAGLPRDQGQVEGFRVPLAGASPLSDALTANRVLVMNQFRKSPYAETPLGKLSNSAAALVIPLVDAAGALGVLTLSDSEHSYRFGTSDEEDARLLGTIATVALRKGLLFAELQRASAAKSDFLASVSHDLRTPLNVIMGYAQLLAEETFGPIVPEQADTLGRILRTATDQLVLINDLLDLARIEQGKLACAVRPVELATLVPSLRETMEMLLRNRPVEFRVAVAADAIASTDAERLRQVLVNLLTNAARFTNEGCVSLAAVREGDAICVSVEDTGPGMDPSLGERALEPFVHGADGPTGSGLGLAIVARLLNLLGGRIAIDSAPGRGTSIRVRLPAA